MSAYELCFVDKEGNKDGGHHFEAGNDGDAIHLAIETANACSDMHAGWMLCSGARVIFKTDQPIVDVVASEMTLQRQEHVLDLEEALQRSRVRVALSGKLLGETTRFREKYQIQRRIALYRDYLRDGVESELAIEYLRSIREDEHTLAALKARDKKE